MWDGQELVDNNKEEIKVISLFEALGNKEGIR